MVVWNVFTQILLPILLLVGAGWLTERRNQLDLGAMVKLNLHLLVPAFIFHQIVSSTLDGAQALRVACFTLSVVAVMFVLGAIVARVCGYSLGQMRGLQLASMFYNSGNYGVPLMSLAYPGIGPLLQVFVIVTQNLSTFTIGLLLTSSADRERKTPIPILRQLSIWAVLCGVLVRLFDVPVQEWRWLWVPVDYLRQALVGVALVTLGVQLANTNVKPSLKRLGWAVALRLVGGPLVAAALVGPFGFHGEEAIVMILSASFPTAVNTALLAHEFHADSEFAAAAVFYSTLASAVTVTAWIVMLRLPQITALF
ncbi:MAG: AEC family transporter [Verrucomicrobia bacterium]|nr:AEC family transporter [Verrucomicrobiota bacterium]